MRRGVSVRAYEAAEEETANGRSGKECASFPKKGGGRREKKGSFARKSTSFRSASPYAQKKEIFFPRKIRSFETKFLLLRLIKHNFPFIPPYCGVYIAQSRGTFPDPPAQTLFDLLNHRDFALSLPYRNSLQRRCPSQSGDICTTAKRPLGLVRKEGGAKACFSSTRKGALAFFGQRALGKPIRFLSCPYAANPTIII